jgi:alkylresorcinol/alkylpyrone synthase
LLDVFENAEIERRYTCVPIDWLGEAHSFGERNDLYIAHATRLGAEVARAVLERARMTPRDVDHVVFVSSTGVATPSIDALLCNQLGFRADVRRTPIWGLGCAGGAAGLARARDFALAEPSARVLLVALELCSLTFQPADATKRNVVAASLFGDGAAAAVIAGGMSADDRVAIELVGSQSVWWKDTLDVMGWSVDGDGLHVVFSRDIPAIVRENVRPSIGAFLDRHGLAIEDVEHLVTHPGGIKVLRAYAEALGLPPERFRHAYDVLRDYGNMSSPSCLFVLERFLAAGAIGAGEHALVSALGPGFSAEYVLLRGVA